jgi:hypothetical protein
MVVALSCVALMLALGELLGLARARGGALAALAVAVLAVALLIEHSAFGL